MKMAETNIGHHNERRKTGQYGSIAIACLSLVVACIIAVFSETWYAGLTAVLIVAIGVGGSTAAKAFVERFPKRRASKETEAD